VTLKSDQDQDPHGIRIGLASWIQIWTRIEIKSWIRIRIEAKADPQHHKITRAEGYHLNQKKQKVHLIENDRVPSWLELPQLENDVIADGEHARVAAPLIQAVVGVQLAQLTRAQQLHQRTLFRILQQSEAAKQMRVAVLQTMNKQNLWLHFFSCLQKKGNRCLQPNFHKIR
jgi:hypothetical protein